MVASLRLLFYQHVSVTLGLNRLLCCVITQDCMAGKHAVFSFGEAHMGGVENEKKCPNLLCKESLELSHKLWFRIGTKLLMRFLWYLCDILHGLVLTCPSFLCSLVHVPVQYIQSLSCFLVTHLMTKSRIQFSFLPSCVHRWLFSGRGCNVI